MKRIPKLVLVVIPFSFAQPLATAAGVGDRQIRARQLIGYFSNMAMSPETLDCSGYSVWLYRVAGRILGDFLYHFNGKLSDDRLAGVMAIVDPIGNEDVSSKSETLMKIVTGD